MTVGDRIKSARIKLGMSQVDFADKINVSKQSLYKYENNIITNIPSDKIEAAARLCGVSPSYLMGWSDSPGVSQSDSFDSQLYAVDTKRFPLLGEIACGQPIYANEDRESYVMAGTHIKADFCVLARGDSMINARILDGDIVFIRQSSDVTDGRIYAVAIDNEVLLKRIYYDRDNNLFQLVSENPAYKPIILSGERLDHITILGEAVAFQSDVI